MTESAKEAAVVVGATGAMGKVIAERLAARGLAVVAVARSVEALAALATTRGIEPCAADIGTDTAIEAIRAAVGERRVRVVVHGPGVPTAGGILTAPPAALVEATNLKVGGMVRLVRAVDERLDHGSRLVAIGGHYGFEPTAYAATAGVCNAALANLVKQLSWAYGPRGITAHLVAPGPADTERLHRVAGALGEREGLTTAEALDQLRRESAIGGFTTLGQVAWGIELLLDPEADALAGSTLFLDAGRRRGVP